MVSGVSDLELKASRGWEGRPNVWESIGGEIKGSEANSDTYGKGPSTGTENLSRSVLSSTDETSCNREYGESDRKLRAKELICIVEVKMKMLYVR
jgi:hypothetical protein